MTLRGASKKTGFSEDITLHSKADVVQRPLVDRHRSGLWAAIAAFFLWGILPVYWKLIDFLPPPSIVAQRTLWSLVILLAIVAWRLEGDRVYQSLRNPRTAAWLLLSGTLLATNGLLYVWATLSGRIIEGVLGYYLNPFFNMLFGVIWFGEKHNPLQLANKKSALNGFVISRLRDHSLANRRW